MEIKNGTDIVFLPRFRNVLAEGGAAFLQRVYLHEELRDQRPERLASIFAAKEAAMKALNLPKDSWHDMCVAHRDSGAPSMKFFELPPSVLSHSLTIAHDGDYVVAFFTALLDA